MHTIWSLGGVLGFALVLSGCQPQEAPPAETETAAMSDEEMLQARVDEFAAAWAGGNAEAIGALFAQEGDTVDPVGTSFHGRAAIVGRYKELLGTMYQGSTISITTTSTRFPRPDVAILDGAYEIRGMKSAEGAETPPVKGLFTNISVKQDGAWFLHCSRPMIPVKAPGT